MNIIKFPKILKNKIFDFVAIVLLGVLTCFTVHCVDVGNTVRPEYLNGIADAFKGLNINIGLTQYSVNFFYALLLIFYTLLFCSLFFHGFYDKIVKNAQKKGKKVSKGIKLLVICMSAVVTMVFLFGALLAFVFVKTGGKDLANFAKFGEAVAPLGICLLFYIGILAAAFVVVYLITIIVRFFMSLGKKNKKEEAKPEEKPAEEKPVEENKSAEEARDAAEEARKAAEEARQAAEALRAAEDAKKAAEEARKAAEEARKATEDAEKESKKGGKKGGRRKNVLKKKQKVYSPDGKCVMDRFGRWHDVENGQFIEEYHPEEHEAK